MGNMECTTSGGWSGTIEEALLDPGKKAKLGEALVQRCWCLLDQRVNALAHAGGRMGTLVFLGSGRPQRTRELFALAARWLPS